MPVPWLVSTTEALAITDPEASRIVPRTSAVSNCAINGAAVRNNANMLRFIAAQNNCPMIISDFKAMTIPRQAGGMIWATNEHEYTRIRQRPSQAANERESTRIRQERLVRVLVSSVNSAM